jgi:uncharacterized membrane-anchored protein
MFATSWDSNVSDRTLASAGILSARPMGSAIGRLLYAHHLVRGLGFVAAAAAAFVALALTMVILSRPARRISAP